MITGNTKESPKYQNTHVDRIAKGNPIHDPNPYASTTGILPIRACHSFGPVL